MMSFPPLKATPDAETLHRLNLKGYGKMRLLSLNDALLNELCELYNVRPIPDTKGGMVSALINSRRAGSPLSAVASIGEDESQEGAATPSVGVFRQSRHGIKLIAFNSLKLRLAKESLQEQWLALVQEMADVDVVLMSEVPAGDARSKTNALVDLISRASEGSGAQWVFTISEPSGPWTPEVHVCLCKLPLRIVNSQTLTHAGDVALDHAPLVVKLSDTRFTEPQTLVLTSVHFPPAARAKDRDGQMKAFFTTYVREAEMRLDEPFSEKGARDARKQPVIHIVAGDFNAYPGAVVDLESIGWGHTLVGSQVATSAGRKSFDHFVPSGFTSSTFNLSWDVLELAVPQNSRLGKIGLSDHDPILLEIKEVRTTKGSAAKESAFSRVSL